MEDEQQSSSNADARADVAPSVERKLSAEEQARLASELRAEGDPDLRRGIVVDEQTPPVGERQALVARVPTREDPTLPQVKIVINTDHRSAGELLPTDPTWVPAFRAPRARTDPGEPAPARWRMAVWTSALLGVVMVAFLLGRESRESSGSSGTLPTGEEPSTTVAVPTAAPERVAEPTRAALSTKSSPSAVGTPPKPQARPRSAPLPPPPPSSPPRSTSSSRAVPSAGSVLIF